MLLPVPRARTRLLLAAIAWIVAAPALGAQAATAPRPAHTPADVHFMQGMIGHHAQAMVMSAMAPTHGAGERVRTLANRILRSQRDEIEVMQGWLRDRGERVPDPADPHAGMDHGADGHMSLMPGMLSAEQLAQLDAARGTEFDRLFLTYMITHHEGALTMVAALFSSPRGGQEAEIFGYASGVDADQRAEIGRMRAILAGLGR